MHQAFHPAFAADVPYAILLGEMEEGVRLIARLSKTDMPNARLALDRAREFGDVNLETKALADLGLPHVQAGRLAEGMAMLAEAMALACGPADDVATTGKSVCSFFTACYYAADFDRASTWAESLRRQGLIGTASAVPVFLSGHCDSVPATALCELGRWRRRGRNDQWK